MQVKITGFADEMAQDLASQIKGLKGLDMTFVEMRGVDGNNLIYHTDEKVAEIKKELDANGIKLSALGSPLGKISIYDPFEPHFDQFKRAVEVAHKMECDNIRMFSFYLPQDCNKADYEEKVFTRIRQMVEYAKNNNVVLLHENEKGIYGDTAAECRRLMDEFYCENFKAIFDFANFVQCKEDTLKGYELLKNYIGYIHVKDAMMDTGRVVPAGYGDGHVKEILKDLLSRGFNGFLSLEPHLSDFEGFEDLEQEAVSIQKSKNNLSGFDSFYVAHTALMKLL